MENEIPDYNSFKEDVTQIFADGDLKDGYNRMINHIDLGFVTDAGVPLTYAYIIDKFKACHKQWDHKYGNREAKFLSKEATAEKWPFDKFIDKEIYNREFVITSGIGCSERDSYIFGSFDRKYLKKQIEEFDKTLQRE